MAANNLKQIFAIIVLCVVTSMLTSITMSGTREQVIRYMTQPVIETSKSISTNQSSVKNSVAPIIKTALVEQPQLPKETVFLLPNDTVLDAMDENGLKELYWRYINTLQVLCRKQLRFGSMKDGGKEICVDEPYIPKQPCLVYSFGSNFQFDFETSIIQNFQCEVHTFDPTMKFQANQHVPPGISFHDTGLDDRTYTNERQWKMSTLDALIKSLAHENRTIDILKIDVEGAEWTALPQIYLSGVLKQVKQLSIEVHYGRMGVKEQYRPWGNVMPKEQLKVLRTLYEQGFHIFMHEHNLFAIEPFTAKFPTITGVNEISLTNIKWSGNNS